MKLYMYGVVLACLAALLDSVTGEEYSVSVSKVQEIDEEGGCQKMVTVTGNGVHDMIPVKCDMADYIVANDKELAVGDKMYSNAENILMVLNTEGCERRTYSDNAVADIEQLPVEDCEELKLYMNKAFVGDDAAEDDDDGSWSVYVGDDTGSNGWW